MPKIDARGFDTRATPANPVAGGLIERVAARIAPLICRPVFNGDCDDIAAGQDFARRVAIAAIAAMKGQTNAD